MPIPGGALAKAALRPLLGLGKGPAAIKGGLVAEGLGARAATRQARELAPGWRDTAAVAKEGYPDAGGEPQSPLNRALLIPGLPGCGG